MSISGNSYIIAVTFSYYIIWLHISFLNAGYRKMPDLGLNLKNIRGDFWGGLTAGIVTLPLALAFGLQSGLGAVSGLYCAIILGLIAVIFGGTPTLISTPTGPMTVVTTLIVAQVVASAGSLESGAAEY